MVRQGRTLVPIGVCEVNQALSKETGCGRVRYPVLHGG